MWVWEFGLILSGQSNVHASRLSCCLHPVEILYVSWDHLVISSHLMPLLIYRSPEVPAVPGRARALFCTLLFLPGHVWHFTPVCLTDTQPHRPLAHKLGSDTTLRKVPWGVLWQLGQRSRLCAPQTSCAHVSLSLSPSPCGVAGWPPAGLYH